MGKMQTFIQYSLAEMIVDDSVDFPEEMAEQLKAQIAVLQDERGRTYATKHNATLGSVTVKRTA